MKAVRPHGQSEASKKMNWLLRGCRPAASESLGDPWTAQAPPPYTHILSQEACLGFWNSHSFKVPQMILMGNQVMGAPREGFCWGGWGGQAAM